MFCLNSKRNFLGFILSLFLFHNSVCVILLFTCREWWCWFGWVKSSNGKYNRRITTKICWYFHTAGSNTYSVWATATNSGDSGYYAGGGAGGGGTASVLGGAGGGGNANNGPGDANTGGGGGGNKNSTLGAGGSGIVIIRHAV